MMKTSMERRLRTRKMAAAMDKWSRNWCALHWLANTQGNLYAEQTFRQKVHQELALNSLFRS